MHQHRKVLRIVRASCSSSRSAATSARVKPRALEDDSDRPKTVGPSKWALPRNNNPGSSSRAQGSHSSVFFSGSSTKPVGMGKWIPPSDSAARTTFRGQSRVPPSNFGSSASSRVLPSKWAPPASKEDHSSSSRNSLRPERGVLRPVSQSLQRDSAPHSTSRLQRDAAPHSQPNIQQDSQSSRKPQPEQFRAIPNSLSEARSDWDDGGSRERSKDQRSWDNSAPERLRYARPERSSRTSHKERGTLLANRDTDDSLFNEDAIQRKQVKRVKKAVVEKKVTVDVYIPSTVSVGTLARLLGVRLEHLQKKMRQSGMSEEAEYNHMLSSDYAILLAEEFGRNPIVNDEAAFDIYSPPAHTDPSTLPIRPPVVTIMGHVDHGKTTLLDTLRSASVAKSEAGGITQHIGAFSVPVPASNDTDGPRSITFLDTPGHAAFSAMRARGAGVTDIVVLVVAADDGIMPQTKEVISLIKKDEGKVGVVVAINKVDKPEVNVDHVKTALLTADVQLEEFGGDIPSVEVSGLTGLGLPALVETLSAIAEMQELRAERGGPVQGYVLESKIHKGLGPVATVLVLRGCLQPGSHIISGLNHAKIKVMNDSTGAMVKAAYPGMAITVSGWKTLPNAGDEVLDGTEAEVKKALANRQRKAEIEASLLDVEAINQSRRQDREKRVLELELGEAFKEISTSEAEQGPKELRLIIKADVSGSAEAVQGALQGMGNKDAATRIVSCAVGDISESDVMMAKAVGGTIVGFSVKTPKQIETLAARNGITIVSSNIIYRLMDAVKEKLIALLPVIIETRVTGEAVILQLFDIQLKAKQTKRVAGCRVTNGIVEKAKFARLVRNGIVLHKGSLDTMRILKKDVTEVRKGTECGLCFGPTFSDLQEGDMIQMYDKIEKPGVL